MENKDIESLLKKSIATIPVGIKQQRQDIIDKVKQGSTRFASLG